MRGSGTSSAGKWTSPGCGTFKFSVSTAHNIARPRHVLQLEFKTSRKVAAAADVGLVKMISDSRGQLEKCRMLCWLTFHRYSIPLALRKNGQNSCTSKGLESFAIVPENWPSLSAEKEKDTRKRRSQPRFNPHHRARLCSGVKKAKRFSQDHTGIFQTNFSRNLCWPHPCFSVRTNVH